MNAPCLQYYFALLPTIKARAPQVVMDILGVAISCTCSTLVLDQLSAGLGAG